MKKSLFEQNEKVLRSSFKINFGVGTARVFKLKKEFIVDFFFQDLVSVDVESS